jgi:AcrR family transcriptional regulator
MGRLQPKALPLQQATGFRHLTIIRMNRFEHVLGSSIVSEKEFDKQADARSEPVREKLLDAAEVLFCEKGFDGTSVRDLTTAAGCNVAAVNYHFGGKDKLYIEMFRRQMHRMFQRHRDIIDRLTKNPNATLEDLARDTISVPIKAIEKKEKSAAVMKLMVREVLNQHIHKEEIIGDFKKEFFPLFCEAMMRFCPGLDLEPARLCMFSLDALVIHPIIFYEVYMDTIPGIKAGRIIEHIVKFASAGIRAYCKEKSDDIKKT